MVYRCALCVCAVLVVIVCCVLVFLVSWCWLFVDVVLVWCWLWGVVCCVWMQVVDRCVIFGTCCVCWLVGMCVFSVVCCRSLAVLRALVVVCVVVLVVCCFDLPDLGGGVASIALSFISFLRVVFSVLCLLFGGCVYGRCVSVV